MSTTKTIYLSKKGMKELKKQLAQLQHRRNEAIADLHDSDRSESHDERLARVEKIANLDIIDSEIADKQLVLSSAKPLPRKRDALKVAIGSVVELLDTNGRLLRYTLVDSFEADPSDGRISIMSPLGSSLLEKQVHDVIEWTAGIGKRRLQVIAIH